MTEREWHINDGLLSTKNETAETIRDGIAKFTDYKTTARNSMGCSESWYNEYYAIAQTFTDEEISKFDENTLFALMRLASNMSEALY